jgi:very-short-patch-repair endonuclease
MVICKECQREFDSLDSLRRHRSQKHGVNAKQTYIDYVLNGIEPKCKCGCGEKPKYLGIDAGFREYKLGHAARVNNNWGHNPTAIKKSHETQKEMYGDGRLSIWNKGLTVDDARVRDNIDKVMANPERGSNISKKLTGVEKSEEHKLSLSKVAIIRWSNQEERDKQKFRRISYMKTRQFNNKNKLETNFENFLKILGLNYESQHAFGGYLFDFCLLDFNIFIEADGDFWHCNPNGKYPTPIYESQIGIKKNDDMKNALCKAHNIKLLRFWETDINNRPEGVITRLKLELGL